VVVVDRPDAPQSELRVGQVGITRRDPDYTAAALLEMVLGGSFSSRLVQNLRERHGYTYTVRAHFDARRAPGWFQVATAVRTDATAASLREIVREIGAIGTVTPDELAKSRALVEASIVDAFAEGRAAVDLLSDALLNDLQPDAWSQFPAEMARLDPAALRAAAERLIDLGRTIVVVVGDRRSLARLPPPLARAPVERRDSGGDLITK
jgi:zinc protease